MEKIVELIENANNDIGQQKGAINSHLNEVYKKGEDDSSSNIFENDPLISCEQNPLIQRSIKETKSIQIDSKSREYVSSENINKQIESKEKQVYFDLNHLKIDIVDYKRLDANPVLTMEKRLVFIVEVQSPPNILPKKVDVPYVDFMQISTDLIQSGYRFLSIQANTSLKIKDTFDNQQVQDYLNFAKKIVWEIQDRKDIICLQRVRNLFKIGDDLSSFQSSTQKYIIPARVVVNIDLIEEELEVSVGAIDIQNDIIYVSMENLTPLGRLGRIWSIVESQVLGGVFAIKRSQIKDEFEYTIVAKRYYDFRILSIDFCPTNGILLLGAHSGNMYYQITNSEEPLAQKTMTVEVGNEAILVIRIFQDKYALLAMPQAIKVYGLKEKLIVQGGSVKKRLNEEEIVTADVDPEKNIFYLGTNKGNVLVFGFSLQKLEFITCVRFQHDLDPLTSLIFHFNKKGENYLFASYEELCTVQKITTVGNSQSQSIHSSESIKAQLSGCFDLGKYMNCEHNNNFQLTCSLYLGDHSVFVGGTQTGLMVCWSSKDGKVLSVQQVTIDFQPIRSLIFESKLSHLIVLSKESMKIFKMIDFEDPTVVDIKFESDAYNQS